MLLQVPIEIHGDGAEVRAHTVVVNRRGAMVLSPRRFREEELVRVQNLDTEKKALCRVVWSGGEELPGLFKVGLEILDEARLFWGESYEAAVSEAPEQSARSEASPLSFVGRLQVGAILLRYTDALHELWCRLSGIEQWPAPGSDDLARQRFDREYDAILAEMALSLPAHRR